MVGVVREGMRALQVARRGARDASARAAAAIGAGRWLEHTELLLYVLELRVKGVHLGRNRRERIVDRLTKVRDRLRHDAVRVASLRTSAARRTTACIRSRATRRHARSHARRRADLPQSFEERSRDVGIELNE